MTHRIAKSHVAGVDFSALVAAHAKELSSWYAHDVLVKAGKADPYPPPAAHPDVDAAVRRDPDGVFTSDFEVYDDGPTPEEVLAKRKADLMADVIKMEEEARVAVIPRGKVRLLALRAGAAAAKEEKERTKEERALLKDYAEKRERHAAIELWGATMHSDIEDLTAKTIDSWKPSKLPR